MILNVEKPYIWLPVSKNAPERKLHFYIEGKKIQEIDIHLGKTDCEFYGCWDASAFLGKDLQVEGADKDLQQDRIMTLMVWFMQMDFIISIISGIHMEVCGEICSGVM